MMYKWRENASFQLLAQTRDNLMTAFVWKETPEGPAYWANIHDRLSTMVNELTAERVVQKLR
jgi:hypothetical protein